MDGRHVTDTLMQGAVSTTLVIGVHLLKYGMCDALACDVFPRPSCRISFVVPQHKRILCRRAP